VPDGGDLGGDRARRGGADLGDQLGHPPPGLGDEAGVGGHAVHQAGLGQGADLRHLGGVHEELHRRGILRTGGQEVEVQEFVSVLFRVRIADGSARRKAPR
jgi:hypothetical protein